MYIKKLKLENFRAAKSLVIPLDAKLNIFAGENGSGKSTILDAAAILLSWLINRIKTPGATARHIAEDDINNKSDFANISLTLNDGVSWSIAKNRVGRGREFSSSLAKLSETARLWQSEISKSNAKINIPLFAYYPVNRAVIDIPLRIRGKHNFDLWSAFDESLTGKASFRSFFEWFRNREDLENEAYKVHKEYEGWLPQQRTLFDEWEVLEAPIPELQYPDPQLEAVRKALEEFMPDFKDFTIERSPLKMVVRKRTTKLNVAQLSDGEKCLMAMIGDLARRLAAANPLLDNPLAGKGIIMIDEIDLHLHPKWQKMVIPQLTKVFPNCQFLISTHSPHVINHVQAKNVFLLSLTASGLVYQPAVASYGKTSERVLEDLMGLQTTRPEEISSAMKIIYEQIDQDLFDEAKASIANLEERIGLDPELVKAKILIQRKELLNK